MAKRTKVETVRADGDRDLRSAEAEAKALALETDRAYEQYERLGERFDKAMQRVFELRRLLKGAKGK